jgi:hypothetical protein
MDTTPVRMQGTPEPAVSPAAIAAAAGILLFRPGGKPTRLAPATRAEALRIRQGVQLRGFERLGAYRRCENDEAR